MRHYRDISRHLRTDDLLDRLERLAREADVLGLLVEAGELEQAVLDARAPRRDGWGPTEEALRRASLAAARALLGGTGRAPAAGSLAREVVRRARAGVAAAGVPAEVRVKAPEGYVHYGLDPEAYADAARRYREEVGGVAARAVVVGIRSIGTSLSAVVAAALGTDRTLTVRPRGRTGSRRIRTDEVLSDRLLRLAGDGGELLLVDEGPGATGETLACAAAWLEREGFEPGRIVLFPSHTGAPSLAPEARRRWLEAARKVPPSDRDPRPRAAARGLGLGRPRDISGGAWRELQPAAEGLLACPPFERPKHVARDDRGGRWLLRWAGLGRWGEETLERARRLAGVGAGPAPRAAGHGYLALPWLPGRPLRRGGGADPTTVTSVVGYLEARSGLFGTGRPVDTEPILAMLEENALEALPSASGLARACERLRRLPEREAVVADARLHAREWVRGPRGLHKADALDHGDGMWLPGPADAAWDLAGAAVEHGLAAEALRAAVRRCARAAGGSPDELGAAVEAYLPPYAACELGRADIAARQVQGEERSGWRAERRRYARVLERSLRAREEGWRLQTGSISPVTG